MPFSKKSFLFLFIAGAILASSRSATAIPVDLTDTTGGFVVSDSNDIIFGPDINDAALLENEIWGLSYLSNDPYLGDPGITIPAGISTLTFDIEFFTSGSDSFEISLLDPSGDSAYFSFFHDGTSEGPGTFEYDNMMIDITLAGTVVGLEFILTSSFTDPSCDAVLTITDVSFFSVPEPSTAVLFGLGILLFGFRRHFRVTGMTSTCQSISTDQPIMGIPSDGRLPGSSTAQTTRTYRPAFVKR